MNEEKINNSTKKLKILVAPLDWGLGHATRCIPIIQTLLKHNTEVLLAANDPVKSLLEKEFPQVKMLVLDGYNIKYSRHKKLFLFNLLKQLPKVFSAIKVETKWLQDIISEEGIDGIIADNRPGLHHAVIPCVYITHQLQIQTGNTVTDSWLRTIHYRFINKFQQCWIPDNEKENIFAGTLSHPVSYPSIPHKYIGILSRFIKKEAQVKYDFLLLISGPEPQRTIFEKKLLKSFDQGSHSFAMVRGLPSENKLLIIKNQNAIVFNHLSAIDLNTLILQSKFVVARAGYSTIMDLVRLEKKAVLIATPGQTEQEYLAKYLNDKGIFASIKQEDVSFENIREAAKKSITKMWGENSLMREEVITAWLKGLSQSRAAI